MTDGLARDGLWNALCYSIVHYSLGKKSGKTGCRANYSRETVNLRFGFDLIV